MKFTLLAIGKIKEKWMRQGIEEYVKRLKPIKSGFVANGDAFLALPARTSTVSHRGRALLARINNSARRQARPPMARRCRFEI